MRAKSFLIPVVLLLILASLLLIEAAYAQGSSFRILWWTVDNGGEASNEAG